MEKRFFAIGFKEYVEVRTAFKPPVERVTHVNRPSVEQRVHTCGPNGCSEKYVRRKLKFTVVCHIGGTVVATMKSPQFRRISGLPIQDGQMIELTPAVAQVCLVE